VRSNLRTEVRWVRTFLPAHHLCNVDHLVSLECGTSWVAAGPWTGPAARLGARNHQGLQTAGEPILSPLERGDSSAEVLAVVRGGLTTSARSYEGLLCGTEMKVRFVVEADVREVRS